MESWHVWQSDVQQRWARHAVDETGDSHMWVQWRSDREQEAPGRSELREWSLGPVSGPRSAVVNRTKNWKRTPESREESRRQWFHGHEGAAGGLSQSQVIESEEQSWYLARRLGNLVLNQLFFLLHSGIKQTNKKGSTPCSPQVTHTYSLCLDSTSFAL